MPTKYSLIIPTIGEKELYEATVEKLETLKPYLAELEVIIVNDGGDKKRVQKVVQSLKRKYKGLKIKHLYYPKNQGKGYAISQGAQVAKGEYLLFIDSDRDIHPKILKTFIKLAQRNIPIAFANKFLPQSVDERPGTRRLISKAFVLLLNLFSAYKFPDTQTGAKMYKRRVFLEILNKKQLKVKGFTYEVEHAIVAQLLGYPIKYVPVHIRNFDQKATHPFKIKVLKHHIKAFKELYKVARFYSRLHKLP